MKTHITTLNNMAGTASLAHRRVLKVAQSIGCHEMGLSFYFLTGMMYRRRVLLSAIKRRFSSRPSGPTATG